ASFARNRTVLAMDFRAAGVRSGAASRFFWAAAIRRRSSRRRTRAWTCRTAGEGGTHGRGRRSRQKVAMARASAGSVLLAWPHALAWALTLAGFTTLTSSPAACRYAATPSEYGPVASRQ